MTLDEAVDRLRSLRARMPELLGAHWGRLEPQVADLLARLEKATNFTERIVLVEALVRLLSPYSAIRAELAPILAVLDRSAGDRGIGQRGVSIERPAMIERTPHMDLRGAETLAVGDRFTVDVYLDTEPFRPGESGASVVLPDLPLLRLRVWLIASDHFRVIGSETAVITVRSGEQASSRATFEVEYVATADGDPGLTATFAYNGRPAGSVRRLVSAVPVPARGRVIVDARAREPDLVVRVTKDPDGDPRHFAVTVSSPLLDEYADGVNGPWRLDSEPTAIVERYMKAFTTAAPGGRKAALVGAGKALFRAAPTVFKDAFWALVDAGEPLESIFVVTEEEIVPWELMIPVRDGVARPALGVDFAFGRWAHEEGISPRQVTPLDDSWVIAPTYADERALDFAEDEARYVADTFRGRRISPAYLLSIDAALAGRAATLLHFVGHGISGDAGQALELDPYEELLAVGLEGLEGVAAAVGSAHPVVFLNACDVGRTTPALAGADGFAAAFARLGASCVIAPLWSVDDAAAEAVARDFYEAIRADPRKPFAAVIAGIRARSYEGENPPDSYAAYCFYGDPLASQAV